ncbi:MAG: rubredoxin [Coriobacteriia bacterium]|nr:rubredoxin [Coriobacteriia bacterium]
MTKYVCGCCGWTYNRDVAFEKLPDDFCCPMCKAPKDTFKKVEEE